MGAGGAAGQRWSESVPCASSPWRSWRRVRAEGCQQLAQKDGLSWKVGMLWSLIVESSGFAHIKHTLDMKLLILLVDGCRTGGTCFPRPLQRVMHPKWPNRISSKARSYYRYVARHATALTAIRPSQSIPRWPSSTPNTSSKRLQEFKSGKRNNAVMKGFCHHADRRRHEEHRLLGGLKPAKAGSPRTKTW